MVIVISGLVCHVPPCARPGHGERPLTPRRPTNRSAAAWLIPHDGDVTAGGLPLPACPAELIQSASGGQVQRQSCTGSDNRTVIRIIRDHNRLNGLWFCAVEFGVVALVCLGLAAFFAAHGAFWLAILGLGIAVNCLPIVWLAIQSIRAGDRDIGLRAMLRREVRAQAQRDVPTMQQDTLILSGATLLPFVVAAVVLLEVGRPSAGT